MSLWDFCIRRPVFTTVLTSALVLFGVLGYLRMGVDLYPRIEPPVVTIQTTLRGASPEVVDQDVTEVLEGEVGSLEGVETIRSQSTESLSSITVEFALDRDIDVAAQEVRDRVGAARRLLPPEADPPIVSKIDTSASPIMWLAVTGEGPYNLLSYYADKVIKERLQTLPGVGGVMMGGFRKRAIRVWLDMDRLASYGLGPADVVRALQRWQVSLPGGRVENVLTESTIQVEGEFADVEELADLVVSWREGAAVRLRDLGRLEDGQEDARGLARFDRVPTIGLGVRKQAGGNTVAVAEAVKAALPRLQAELPDWVKIKIAFDSSRFIEGSLEGARFDILFGALFTCVVIWFFLRTLQPTLISVLAIPTSLVGTFFLMWKMGFTINQMSLLGMALAVGLVIDDAIVVLESISRHIEQGEEPARAASTGTREVAFAVMAATFSIAAIFVPVGFMQGVIGQFFQQFGLTVALTILTSLVVSLTLTPMLCSRWMRHRELHNPLSVAIGRLLAALDRSYRRLLRWCVRGAGTRLLVLGVALALFAASLGLASRLGREFMPATDDSRFLILFEAPLGTSLGATDRRARQLEEILFSHPEVQGAFMAAGLLSGEVHKGLFFVTLVPRGQRQKRQIDIMNELRQEMSTVPGMKVFLSPINPLGTGGPDRTSDVAYVLQGPDLPTLDRLSRAVVDSLTADGHFTEVSDDLELTRPQVNVFLDRTAAADVGLDTREIASAIQAVMGGVDAARFKSGGQQYEIRVKALEGFRSRARDIEGITVRTSDGRLVKLGAVVRVQEGLGPNAINRYNRQRSTTLQANSLNLPQGEANERFLELARRALVGHPEYKLVPTGGSKTMQEAFAALGQALLLSILIVYLTLAAQFESFVHPFTVMLTLPLASVGVFGALWAAGMTLNIFSFIGIIMLVGIVTRNAILLVDYINQLRRRGLGLVEAVLEGCPVRLRPILMTAVAAMVGVVPVALGHSEGGEARAPMGVAVIGGLFSSTLLTLLVIPVVYIMLDQLFTTLRRRRRRGADIPAGGSARG